LERLSVDGLDPAEQQAALAALEALEHILIAAAER
jgi:hypothetical protein